MPKRKIIVHILVQIGCYKMPLIYSCIARGNVILVERNTGPGNISSEAQNILADFTETGNRKTTKPGDEYV